MRKKRSKLQSNGKYALLFLAPWLIGIVIYAILPMLASLYYSFTNYNMFNTPKLVGMRNYLKLFQDARLLQALKVTAKYVLIGVPLQLTFSLFLAVKLSDRVPGARFFRAAYYIPSLLGGSVAVAMLWRQIFGADGLLNKFLFSIGCESLSHTVWLQEKNTAIGTLILLLVWQFGSCMVIFVSGIKNIPASLYESAAIDGAGPTKRFFKITFPMLTPIIFFNLIMQIISAFQAFTPAFIVGKGSGGYQDSMLFYTLYLYFQAFNNFNMGYASAMAWFLLLMIGAIALLLFLTSKFWVYYDD